MPFDEEDNDQPSNQSQKIGLKKVSSQKSIFESMPKKPTPEEFEGQVKKVQEKASHYKAQAADLAISFNKAMLDKTLQPNKNVFQQELEKELLGKMIQLAIDINNDRNEQEGMGSLTWITLLLRTCFSQRDKINRLEYALSQFEKKFEPMISDIVKKEISKALDGPKKNE
jgi:hypothetical protein